MEHKFKILIIEDNLKIARELALMLSELGYDTPDEVNSYQEALDSFKKNLPDLALCDIKLHGYRDGIQTVKDLKKIKDILVIYITAFFEDEIVERAMETEPEGYLLKPVSFQQLEVALKMAFKSRKLNNLAVSASTPDDFYVCVKGVYEHIVVDDILYLEADNVGTKIITTQKTYDIPSKTLKRMLEDFHHPQLLRVSRSEVINLRKIKQFDKGITYIMLENALTDLKERVKKIIFVSKPYREELKKELRL